MLTFQCDGCDLDFDSEPDGTGYDQALCPTCGQLCVTRDFIEEQRRRNRLPIPRFTLRTLLLVVMVASVFLGISVASRSLYCETGNDGYIYGFPFPAVRVPFFRTTLSIDIEPLIGDVVVFLLVLLGISRGLNWAASRRAATHPARESRSRR